ncbi:MAG TPA: transcriptional regulator [Candidatus Thermoplasmatota archaeon]|nr:transcriptional regulator [Candidatus Thermoplasmatota archaeon]
MRREEVLEYEARRRLYGLISEEPGLHMRELERRSRMPLSTLRHHLRYLAEHALVDAVEDRNVVRYFAATFLEPVDRMTLGALRQESLRRVLLYLLQHGGAAAYKDLLADIGAPASTLAVYLAELTRRELVERRLLGRESRYELRDAERVVRLLHTYRASFLDALVDHLLDVVYQDEP